MVIQVTIEEDEETLSKEAEEADLPLSLPILLHHKPHFRNRLNLLLKGNLRDLLVKSVGSKDTMPLTVITE
jgi:hypothetical protein